MTSTPSTRIEPLSIGTSALMQRSSVDLPDPDGPMTQTVSPRATVRETSRSTTRLPNRFSTLVATTSGGPSVRAIAGQPFTLKRRSSAMVQRAIG